MAQSEFEGIYGKYKITIEDELEVKRYRISVLALGVSFCCGLAHWLVFGPEFAYVWILTMSISLGLALQWIHIYLRPLHQLLKLFWAIGSLGICLIMFKVGPQEVLTSISSKPVLELLIGPYFAALTGLGFKEFFCFRRPEAIGMTIFLPIALLGHFLGVLNSGSVIVLLCLSAMLLLIMALRKFGLDASLDVGDKSIFEHMKNQQSIGSSGI